MGWEKKGMTQWKIFYNCGPEDGIAQRLIPGIYILGLAVEYFASKLQAAFSKETRF
jgi:hypothetical protein